MNMTSTNRFLNYIRCKTTLLLLAGTICFTSMASAQSFDEEGIDEGSSTEQSSGANDIWGDQTPASAIGSTDISTTPLEITTNKPANSATGHALRPAAGPTPDATGGPGGNPDVPFDTNMNILFLAIGLVFAFIIFKKRSKLSTVRVVNNKD